MKDAPIDLFTQYDEPTSPYKRLSQHGAQPAINNKIANNKPSKRRIQINPNYRLLVAFD
jgi:hypothetical protein